MINYEIEVSLGPDWIKKVMVISHERSGTHFLMNTLADNFRYISMPWVNIDFDNAVNCWAPENIVTFLDCMKGKPVLNVVKSHHQVEFFLPILGDLLKEFHIFYIYRRMGEVMESLCTHLKAIDWDAGPKVEDGKTLREMEPSGALMRYQKHQYRTMYDRWVDHVKGWSWKVPPEAKSQIIYVRFSDLRDGFEETVRMIAKRINRAIPEQIVKPKKGDRVVI